MPRNESPLQHGQKITSKASSDKLGVFDSSNPIRSSGLAIVISCYIHIDCKNTDVYKCRITETERHLPTLKEHAEVIERVRKQEAERFSVEDRHGDICRADSECRALIKHLGPPVQSLFGVKPLTLDGRLSETTKHFECFIESGILSPGCRLMYPALLSTTCMGGCRWRCLFRGCLGLCKGQEITERFVSIAFQSRQKCPRKNLTKEVFTPYRIR